MQTLVMTIIGDDRPGLVDTLSSTIADGGGNWLESRMAHLAGQFAGILRVQVADDAAPSLIEAVEALGDFGLQVTVRSTVEALEAAAAQSVRLELIGQDRPGIVKEIARAIAARGVNVEDLNTGCESAPMSGEPLFRVSARLGLPAGFSMNDLQVTLEGIATDLMVDVTLQQND